METIAYKYRAIGKKGSCAEEYTRRLVQNGEFYFAPPSKFNDTFEAFPAVNFDFENGPPELRSIPAQIKEVYENAIFTAHLSLDVKANLSENIGWVLQDIFVKYCDDSFGILCASQTNSNIQQWSYYADEHQGICIEFEVPETFEKHPIVYSKNRPIVDIFRFLSNISSQREMNAGEILKILTTKSIGWKHEDEIRIIKSRSGTLNLAGHIRAIYVGVRACEKTLELLQSWVAQSQNPSTPIIPMSMNAEEFVIQPKSKGGKKFNINVDTKIEMKPFLFDKNHFGSSPTFEEDKQLGLIYAPKKNLFLTHDKRKKDDDTT